MIARIGKYTIEKELGHGGFGDVFLAYDPDVGQKVAIKHLRVELGTDPDMLRRFQHEIRTTASLRHKNIVAIFASGVESGNPYLVMEFLEGRTLKDIIQAQQPLTLLEKVGIMTQAAEGLAYAHTKGIVHRDVKPENIMLLPDDTVKIMDFGIALAPDRNTVMTETGGIIGTPPYFAPEQLQGYKANEQTDIFSLGDVYYELLTGQHPFERFKHDWKALQMAILSFDPPAVSQLAPGCPEALELLVHRMIAKEREFRYETFQDVLLYSKAILVDLQRDRAASIVREVTPLVERGDLQAALGKLGEAQQLDPGNREARQLRDTITQRLQKTQVQGRVSELLSEAEAFAGERRFAEAVQSLESAARLDSSNVTVQVRLGGAKAKLDSSVRASRLVSEARFQQQKGQLTDALDRLAAALAIDPDHTEALALSPRVRELVERQARDNRRERAIQIASELLSAHRYSEALSAIEQIEQEQPGLADVAQLRARIHQGKAEHEQRQRAERLNLGVTRTREAMQAGELDRAGQMLDHLLANFANEPGAAGVLPALREQLNAQIRAQQIAVCRQEARDLLQKKSYREALDLLDGALRKFPDDTGLMRLDRSVADLYKAHQRSEAIAAAMNEAGVKRDAGDYQGALDRISVARGNLGDEPALVEVARQLELEIEQQRYAAGLEELLQASRELMAAGKYSQAIDRIAQAPEYAGEAEVRASLESARVSQAIEEEHRVVSTALAAAERLSSQGDWAAALEPLEKALGRYPHDPGLKQTADRLREQIARERRRAAIENHRSTIRREIQDQAWKKAEAALHQARSEFPGEKAFDDLAGQVETGLYNTRLDEVASGVRQKLAANSLPEAVEEIELSRTVFAHDSRWKSLAEEVAKRKEYEAALLEAEGNRKKGDLPKAEALLTTVIRAGPPDQRATQILRSIQAERSEAARQAEIAAAAGKVRELLQRGDLERASSELENARAMYPGQSAWATLQADIEARQAVLRRQAEVPVLAESIRRCLAQEDVRRGTAELAVARAKYPGESLWPTLQAEIDALQKSLQRRAEVAELVENLRACLKRNDTRQATALLNAGRSTFPNESVWVTLQSEIEALQVSLTEMEIAAVAGSVRGCLRRNDIPQASSALSAARAKYQDRAIWATLQSEIDACQESLQRQAGIAAVLEKVRGHLALDEIRPAVAELLAARGKYPDEPVWATIESEINARQTVLKRRAEIAGLAQSVRGRLERGDVGEAASELEAARAKYPGESQWATLQAGIDARQAVLRRQAEVAAIAKSVREHLVRDHLREAASELGTAVVKYPDENLWATLRSELDARQAALKEQAAAAAREAKAAKIAEDRLKHEASKAAAPVPVPEPPVQQPIPFWRRPVGIGVLGLGILVAGAGAYKLTHLQPGVPDGAGAGSGVHVATTSGGATGGIGSSGSTGTTAATGGAGTGTHIAEGGGGATGTSGPTGVVAPTGGTPPEKGDPARAARIGDLINRRDWAGASREWASVSASLRKTPAFSALASQLKAHDDKAALLEQARADLQGERLQAAEAKARSLLGTEFQPESQKVIDDVHGKVDSFADQVKRQIDDKNAAEAKKRLQLARKDYPADSRWDALAARIADLEKPAANPCPPAPQAPGAKSEYGGNDSRQMTWTGQLPQGCKLVLIGDRASTGSLTGLRFVPSLPAEVRIVGGEVTVLQQPSAENNFTIELMNNSPRPVLTIQMFWTRKR